MSKARDLADSVAAGSVLADGVVSVSEITSASGANLNFADNSKAIFGAGSDLQIYHNGSNSLIEETGTGALIIRSNSFALQNAAGNETIASMSENGAVSLFFDNAAKLATTSTGIDVTGTVVADGLTVDGNSTISGTSPQLFFQTGASHYNWQLAAQENVSGAFEISSGNIDAVASDDTYTKRLIVNNNGDISFYEDTGTTAKFFWDASAESLGIGMSSPTAPLTIRSFGATGRAAEFNGSNVLMDGAGAFDLIIGDGGVAYMSLTTTDNATALKIRNYTGNSDIAVFERTTGNVGIGVNLPAYLLDVNGDASIYGVRVGRGAGAVTTNTAVGASVMSVNTGSNNSAFGNGTLNSNISGADNTGLGRATLATNTTGQNNTASGSLSMLLNLSGNFNTAYGAQSLYSNSTASNNTAVGYQAGYSNTTGTPNVAIGSGSLSSNTTGGSNVANGYWALQQNTEGSYNTGIGRSALQVNTTGNNNTAVGYQAGYSNTTNGNSAFFGSGAGYNSDATRGTFIGYNAGYYVTGAGNTMIGSDAGIGASSGCTGTRNIAIGTWFDGSQEGPLASFTTGSGNIAMAYGSLKNLTSGENNIAIGFNTAQNTTIGANNISIGVGATPPATNTANSITMGVNATGKGTDTGFINPNGGGVYQGNNSSTWSTTSDQRLKKNIVDNNDGLEKINAIQVRNFEYRLPEEVDAELAPTDAVKKAGVQLGVIAQELHAVLPDCVKTESTGVMSVNSDNLIWYAINAIKELKAENDSLKARLDAANL